MSNHSQIEQEVMVIASEAYDEARRLTKVHGRDVAAVTHNCCEYDHSCGCGGQGYRFVLVFDFCSHEVGDGTGEECESERCIERSAEAAMKAAVPFSGIEKPMKSYREFVSEQVEEEAVA